MQPDQPLRCLLVQPAFDPESPSFWNLKRSCSLTGASVLVSPVGLVTVAAILPQTWDFRLRDLNVGPVTEEDWEWADLVCIGEGEQAIRTLEQKSGTPTPPVRSGSPASTVA